MTPYGQRLDFVVHKCRCHSSGLVGALNTLVPFVYYLFHAPHHEVANPEVPRARAALYLFAFSKTFSRYGESRIGAFIRNVLRPRLTDGDFGFPLEDAVRRIAPRDSRRLDSDACSKQQRFEVSVTHSGRVRMFGSVQLSVAEQASPAEEKPEPISPLGVDTSELQW